RLGWDYGDVTGCGWGISRGGGMATSGENQIYGALMKLACADFTFPLLEHGKVLELIAALDFNGVDIGLFEGRSHLWPSKEFRNVSGSAKALKKKLNGCGLACADIFLQMAPSFIPYAINQPEPARRRKAR